MDKMKIMKPSDLSTEECAKYFFNYIDKVPEKGIMEALHDGNKYVIDLFESLPSDKHEYRYAEGKWTPKEMLIHIIDTERIFAYRALRIARGDKTPMAGFEQDDYIPFANANARSMSNLIEDFKASRASSIAMFNSFDDEMLKRTGTSSGGAMSARAAGYIIAGHELHHGAVLKERYF